MPETCLACHDPAGPVCPACQKEEGRTWFRWEGVPFLLDAGMLPGRLAVLEVEAEVPGQTGPRDILILHPNDDFDFIPTAVFLPAGLFEAVRDYLAEHGDDVEWG